MTSDLDLLGQYARKNLQDAFAEIVRRHLNLVFSAALRQVRSPQLAEEITQSVFADLARNAGKISGTGVAPVSSLTPWLYQVTRRTAIDVIRKESRRQLREQIAVEMNNMNATESTTGVPPVWSEIEPLLDEAMDTLDDADRAAVLLRYFENKSLREVGATLGTTDDAAQKRVSRAVERLRDYFSKRNVAIGASGLVVLISANAVQAAPIGLAATISAAAVLAGTAVSTSTAIAATKAIAMTTLQKTLVTATLAAAIGTGIYEAHQASHLREQNQTLQQQQAPLADQLQQLQRERDDATNRLGSLLVENERLKSNPNATELLKLRGEVTRLHADANEPEETTTKSLLAKVNKLKQRLEETPNAKIPELRFLTGADWIHVASQSSLDTENDLRCAMSATRDAAERKFAKNMLYPALQKYQQANGGQFPTDLSQLQSYFDTLVDDAVLERWEIASSKTIAAYMGNGGPIITEKTTVDELLDDRDIISSDGASTTSFFMSENYDVIQPVIKAFGAANNGQHWTSISQLLPYAATPEQQAAIQNRIEATQVTGQAY